MKRRWLFGSKFDIFARLPKADITQHSDGVCFVPNSEVAALFLIGS
jgi:hypothetical protein